jgi:hypothetical protein
MPGDVGAVATFLTVVAEIFTDPTKFAQWSREKKLSTIRDGLDAAIDNNDWIAADKFMAQYRVLASETGP